MIGLGLGWAWLASSAVRLAPSRRWRWWLLASLAILAVLNARALFAGLPWSGDEDHHFDTAQKFMRVLMNRWPLAIITAGGAAALLFWRRRPAAGRPVWRGVMPALIGLAVVQVLFTLICGWAPGFSLARYPVIVDLLAAVGALLALPVAGPSAEAPFRVIPFLSAVLLAWVCCRRMRNAPAPVRLLYILAVGTIPVVFYYSSILYLEMPAVLLMTIVCFDAKALLGGDWRGLMSRPAWYALVLIGFVKETTLPFLASFLICRLAVRWLAVRRQPGAAGAILREARVAFCVLCPLAVFLAFRACFNLTRPAGANLANLLVLDSYAVLLRSYWGQFGLLGVLFPGGLAVLAARRQWGVAAFLVLAFASHNAMHLLDSQDYVGYSRFNLFLAPMVIVGAHQCLAWAGRRGQGRGSNPDVWGLEASTPNAKYRVWGPRWLACGGILAAVAAGNLVMSPVNLDGTKKHGAWRYRMDLSEHYYPYREALRWLESERPAGRVLLTGMNYWYKHEFYTGDSDRYEMRLLPSDQRDEAVRLERVLETAGGDGFVYVLYHVQGSDPPRPANTHGYVETKVFRNQAHVLVLYSRRPGDIGEK